MARRYIVDGLDVPVSAQGKFSRVIAWSDPGGIDTLYKAKKYNRPRGRKIEKVVFHWGGDTPAGVAETLHGRGLSTHLGLDDLEIHQFVDFADQAWHAAGANKNAIGLDINERAQTKRKSRQDKEGDVVAVVKNTTGRGDKKTLSLDPTTAETVREFIRDMSQAFGIPIKVPVDAQGNYFFGVMTPEEIARFKGFMGHFHASFNKWDIAPWWAQIFDPLFDSGEASGFPVVGRAKSEKKSEPSVPGETSPVADLPGRAPTGGGMEKETPWLEIGIGVGALALLGVIGAVTATAIWYGRRSRSKRKRRRRR